MPYLAQEHISISCKDILSWCRENDAVLDGDKDLYVDCADPKQKITRNEAWTLIRKLIAGFTAAGLQKGDVVCIHAFNFLHYPILVQSIVGAGGVFVGTNPSYTPYELQHALKVSKAQFVITEEELLGGIEDTALSLGISQDRMLLVDLPNSHATTRTTASWRTLLSHGEMDWIFFDDESICRNTTAMLMFSSGTTGLPKAAQLSHYNLIAEHTLVHENPRHPERYTLSSVVVLPLFHAAMAPYTHVSALRSGYQTYIGRRFGLLNFLDWVEISRSTRLIMVPPMVTAVLNLADSDARSAELVRRKLQSVRSIVVGAAPLDKETQAGFQELLPLHSAFTQVWAMTETSCIATMFHHPENDNTGSVGRFLPGLDAKIIDDDGHEVSEGVRGELCVRGPTVIRGYLDNAEANKRDWDAEGFFHTGDIVHRDPATKLFYVVDRKKELIKVRGFQVAPSEIEAVLLSHPQIQDAAVIGVSNAGSGELPRAYIVSEEGTNLGDVQVKSWVAQRLAKYKALDGGIIFVSSIPKTASGKILKRLLREMAKMEMSPKL